MKRFFRIGEHILLIILMISTIYLLNKPQKIIENNPEKLDNKSNLLSMMLEQADGSYQESHDNVWQDDKYIFNKELSGCENGSEIEWDEKTNSVKVSASSSDRCYAYFDREMTGEEESPYKIETIEDLVELSNKVNAGENYQGKYFVLTKDLDFKKSEDYENPNSIDYGNINGVNGIETIYNELNNQDGSGFVPIGLSESGNNIYFGGTLDGREHTINNLYINISNNTAKRIGLFGHIVNGTIKNLTITGTINSTTSQIIGALVGTSENTTINNFKNYVNVNSSIGRGEAAGIVGSSNNGTYISNSFNYGNISGGNQAGGIVSYNDSGSLTIENCTNYGEISNPLGNHAGGILGKDNNNGLASSTINNSINNGHIIMNSKNEGTYAGGISGRITGNIVIDKSKNNGNVTDTKTTFTNGDDSDPAIGGLLGLIYGGKATITNSTNIGSVTGGKKTAGILGYSLHKAVIIIANCHNSGEIASTLAASTTKTTTSGIMGYNQSSTAYILNSSNSANVSNSGSTSATFYAMGIVFTDYAANSYIINSYNTGDVTSSFTSSGITLTTGGGGESSITINNVYNLGTVSGSKKYGLAVLTKGSVTAGYYKNDSYTSGGKGTSMAEADMLADSFVTTLNNNKNTIDLGSVNTSLSDYNLCNWQLGESGYPELSC